MFRRQTSAEPMLAMIRRNGSLGAPGAEGSTDLVAESEIMFDIFLDRIGDVAVFNQTADSFRPMPYSRYVTPLRPNGMPVRLYSTCQKWKPWRTAGWTRWPLCTNGLAIMALA